MALEAIVSDVYLDVYDHDTTPTTIKTIASDSQTRYVRAYLQKRGEVYNPDTEAEAYLMALRPDRSVVIGPAEIVTLVEGREEETGYTYDDQGLPMSYIRAEVPAVYGLLAEIKKEMTEIVGTITFQFKIVKGDTELRTEVFKSINGVNIENAGNCVIEIIE